MYNRHTTVKQSAETAEASLSGEQSGTTPSTRMNAPTSSADKGTTISETSKEKTEKNAVPSDQEQVEGKENVGKKTRSLPLSEGEYADMRQAEILRDNPDMDEVDAYNMAIDEFPSYIKEKVDSGELAELFGKLSIGEQIKEKVNLLYPATKEELKRRISQVSTEPNSPLNAPSSASGG